MIHATLPLSSPLAGLLTCDDCKAIIQAGERYIVSPDLAGVAPARVSCLACGPLYECESCGQPIGGDEDVWCGACVVADD